MTRLILRLLLANFLIAGILFTQGYWYWLLNFELAFLSSVFIIMGSFSGYKNMINNRLSVGEGMNDELLDKLEDPYNLYDDDKSENFEKEDDLVTVVKEEKKRLKGEKQTIKKTLKSSKGIFSPLRFLPYAMLIMSFIALNNNHILDISAFLVGLGVGIAAAILLGRKWIETSS